MGQYGSEQYGTAQYGESGSLVWDTAADWDAAQREQGVQHPADEISLTDIEGYLDGPQKRL